MSPLIFIIVVFIIWYHCNVRRINYAMGYSRRVWKGWWLLRGGWIVGGCSPFATTIRFPSVSVVERESLLRNSLIICRSVIYVHSPLQPTHTPTTVATKTPFLLLHIYSLTIALRRLLTIERYEVSWKLKFLGVILFHYSVNNYIY